MIYAWHVRNTPQDLNMLELKYARVTQGSEQSTPL